MLSFRPIARAIALLAVWGPGTWAVAGVADTPLPTFSDAKPALRVVVVPATVKNNNLDMAVVCTNLAASVVDVGLEVFDQSGTRGNTIVTGNGALLNVGPGATVTIATNNTAILHEDAVITLEAPVTSLSNGSARVVATSTQVGCVAFGVDAKHSIADPVACPTCPTPAIVSRPLDHSAGGATTTTVTTSTTTTTTLAPLCASTPRGDCRAPTRPGKSRLLLKHNADDTKDLLVWKWVLGAATTLADYGSPTTTSQYALCVYDHVDGVPELVSEADVAPGRNCGAKPCWTALPNGLGFKYGNTLADPDGLTKILLRVGADGRAKIAIKGKGTLLPMPALPLQVSPNVVVQLGHGAGPCWGATYGSTLSNSSTLFKAASD